MRTYIARLNTVGNSLPLVFGFDEGIFKALGFLGEELTV